MRRIADCSRTLKDTPLLRTASMVVLCQIWPTPVAISCPHIGWGTPVAYAASDREVALEGEGDNSPFATGLTRPNELTGRIQMPVSKKRRRCADLAVLSRSQSLSPASHRAAQDRLGGTVRSHLHAQDRLRHPRSPARSAPCQQRRIALGAGAARDPAPHQRIGERCPLPGHQAKGQRRHKKQHRSRLPRRLPRPH